MKIKLFPVIFLFYISLSFSQVTFVISKLPKETPDTVEIYISGDFEGWSGGQENYKLQKGKNGNFSITLPQRTGDISFKFTCGSWITVEKDLDGKDILNRTYTFGGYGEEVKIDILSWSNSETIESTAAKNVQRIEKAFLMPYTDSRERNIWIYLPPHYQESKKSYPVLYMHDGQNLFDKTTSYAGEWNVDETLNSLFEDSGFEMIVVGIENGPNRMTEYSPWTNPRFGNSEGKEYVKFIVDVIKPFIDKTFRTNPKSELTGIAGSSMGGLISFYAALEYPEVFGKAIVYSPSFWYSGNCLKFAHQKGNQQKLKFYFMAGEDEGVNVISDMDEIISAIKKAGFNKENIYRKIVPGGEHNEKLWREDFKNAVKWLFEIK